MAKIKTCDNTQYGWGCEGTGTLIHCWWKCKTRYPLWKSCCLFCKRLDIHLRSKNPTPRYLAKLIPSLPAPSLNPYTSNWFKCSPNRHIFSHLDQNYFSNPANCTQHLLTTIDKTNPVAIRLQTSAALWSSLTQRLPTLQLRQVRLLTGFPSSPKGPLLYSLSGWWPCVPLWKVSFREGLPLLSNPVQVLPNKACVLLLLMIMSLPWLSQNSDSGRLWDNSPSLFCKSK